MRFIILLISIIFSFGLGAQNSGLTGKLIDAEGEAVGFANLALYQAVDTTLIKVETSDINGKFTFSNIPAGVYKLEASFIGFSTIKEENISLLEGEIKEIGNLTFGADAVKLETAVVKAKRAMVEIKADRTVFNVEGTINSAGDNGLGLLRKAPGVLVDNNDNISVLSRSGVLFYVDGRKLPLTGEALTAYLQNLPAEQIDRIDIITNPGAKYEAQGNAGIIDIRLKKDKNLGSNGSVSGNVSQGKYMRSGINLSGNYRNKRLNTFGTIGLSQNDRFHNMEFLNYQNNILLDEVNNTKMSGQNINLRFGTDFFINKNSTIGFLYSGAFAKGKRDNQNTGLLSQGKDQPIDSILIAHNTGNSQNVNNTLNLNYSWQTKEQSINIDADYGRYQNDNDINQPNLYYDPTQQTLLKSVLTAYNTPVIIDIATIKIDYERPLAGGKLGIGSKLSKVKTDNTFLFYDVINEERVRNDDRSNIFLYDENVYAAYLNYTRSISKKLNFSSGIRTEITDATGDLTPFDASQKEDPVHQNYTSFFPTVGFTYKLTHQNTLSLNYGSRINRPDYNVLNPFRTQLSELSFRKGNPFLVPEIVHNVELGYTLMYRFNFKLAYSRTLNQITRLIAPDDTDIRAGFITWENLATQSVYSFNTSLPFSFNKWWSAFFNGSMSYIDNQAVYDDGGVVDIQAFTYSLFQQHTFKLGKGYSGEVSGWYSGPGVWGGVFRYDPSYSVNLGVQKKFLGDKMNVKLSASDLFNTSGWHGESVFNGLVSEGQGSWDGQRISLAISYNFGNSNVKSRKRKTGLDTESKRVKSN